MISKKSRTEVRVKKHRRLRNHLAGTAETPRLAVFRSNNHMYAQILDKDNLNTIVAASTLSKDIKGTIKNGGNKEAAILVGKLVATKAKEKNIEEVVFDRSGFLYHGRVKALADSARENGLKF